MGQQSYEIRSEQLDALTTQEVAILGAREITRSLIDIGDGPGAELHGWTWEEVYRFLRIALSLWAHLRHGNKETRDVLNSSVAAFSEFSGPRWEASKLFDDAFEILDAVAPDRNSSHEIAKAFTKWLANRKMHSTHYGTLFSDLEVLDSRIAQNDFAKPLWLKTDPPEHAVGIFLQSLDQPPLTGSFWRDWYQGFLDGKPLDWELQRRVALIPDEDWEKGPAHIAEKIKEIRAVFDEKTKSNAAREDIVKPVPPAAAQAMARRMAANREAITLSTAGLLEQIVDFREVVRGNNQLDPDFKERLLGFLDDITARLNDLMGLLPPEKTEIADPTGEKGVRWLVGFKHALLDNAREYIEPKNVAGAAIPTSIILTCTGIGSMLGMPVAGTVIGGLLTGQLKPGKAADDLLKPTKPDVES